MKQVGHGHVLVIKEECLSENIDKNVDSDYLYFLSSQVFDDSFSNYYIGGSGFAINTANPNHKFETTYSSAILSRAFSFIEEKLRLPH